MQDATSEFDVARIRSRLRCPRYGRTFDIRAVTDSTNDDARAAVRAGASQGHVIIADRQDRGRGAYGRSWSSPGGTDLYLSIIDRITVPANALPPLTLAVGLGVAHAIETAASGALRALVKWPNDVLVAGRKCAGVLVESVTASETVQSVVIGIGLNVNRLEWPDDLSDATSLRHALQRGEPLSRADVLAEVLSHVGATVEAFERDGAASITAALVDRLAWRDAVVCVGAVCGRLETVAPDGALSLVAPNGRVLVRSGSLRLRTPGASATSDP